MAEYDANDGFRPLISGVMTEPYRGEQESATGSQPLTRTLSFFVSRTHRFEDHGDVALAVADLHGCGRASGAEIQRRSVHIARFTDGKIVWWSTFATRREALEAVGLRK